MALHEQWIASKFLTIACPQALANKMLLSVDTQEGASYILHIPLNHSNIMSLQNDFHIAV